MRLWSIHPKYLDSKGLVALWRESLLAKKVLEGKTRGYKHHPQLIRFKEHDQPIMLINSYLYNVYKESCTRGYCFDRTKIGRMTRKKISVTNGQLEYEFMHLKRKRETRKSGAVNAVRIEPNPVFAVVRGPVAYWERVKP